MKLQPTKEPTRILLSEAARKHLEATGEDVFVVTAMNKSEERTGRWVFYLVPTIYSQANSAARVAMGISTERKKTKTETVSVLPPAPPQAATAAPGDHDTESKPRHSTGDPRANGGHASARTPRRVGVF